MESRAVLRVDITRYDRYEGITPESKIERTSAVLPGKRVTRRNARHKIWVLWWLEVASCHFWGPLMVSVHNAFETNVAQDEPSSIIPSDLFLFPVTPECLPNWVLVVC